jgi:amino acid adenylation domain-containing protein
MTMRYLLHHFLSASAQRSPHATALVAGTAHRSFRELAAESEAVARTLQDLGVGRGDRVAVMLENSIEFVSTLFAISRAGAVFVPIDPSTKTDKLVFLLNDCGVRALVAGVPLTRHILPALAHTSTPVNMVWVGDAVPAGAPGVLFADAAVPDGGTVDDPGIVDQDLAAILYTSGTTGQPKGVMLTHANLCNTTRAIASYLGNTPDDVVMCMLPLNFGYGLTQALTGALVGFTLMLERSFAFPADIVRRIAEHRVTGLPGVPSMFARLLQTGALERAELGSLRYLTSAAAPMPPAHIRRLQQLLPRAAFFSMYGQTECTRVCFLDPIRLHDKIATVGKAIPNCEAVVVDQAGRPVAPGEVGELTIRGANVMRGYWGQPEATARRLRPGPLPGETVLMTGDLFSVDEEGFLTFVARADDIFKCRGEKVSPKEIESVLCELDAVAEAAVTGVPDPADGMAVKAFVVVRPGMILSPAQIIQHCRGRLEGHLVPREVEIVADLPRTESGKIKRNALEGAA